MRTLHIRSFAPAAFTFLLLTGSSGAQELSGALNSAEVRQLVERGEPGDHARLAAHFAALGERYATEARRHTSMQQSYARNHTPKLAHMVTSMSAHCKKLSDGSLASAKTLQELAAEHGKAAGGAAPSTPPVAATAPDAGRQARFTDKELSDLAATATSAADHRRLEQYFGDLAARYDRDAANHAAYARSWRATTKVANAATIAAHCDRFATQLRDLAKEARAAATMHKEQAATAK